MSIGIVLVTYNRQSYAERVFASIRKYAPEGAVIVVVNDGEPYKDCNFEGAITIFNNEQLGVGQSKNIGIAQLLMYDCEHIFVQEDDIELINDAYSMYIDAYHQTKIRHFNFQHSNQGSKTLRSTYECGTVMIQMFRSPEAGLSYFHKSLFEQYGQFDPVYMNAFEHIDFEYRLVLAGAAPPFWWFPDVYDSREFAQEILDGPQELRSTITDKTDYEKNYAYSANHFIQKHDTWTSMIKDASESEARAWLIQNFVNHGK